MTTLAELRQAAGISQRSLAKQIGVAQATLSIWERGQATIPPEGLRALAVRLGVPSSSIAARQPFAASLGLVAPAKCGTYSGAIAHARRREKPCEACRKARNEYAAGRRVPHPRPPAECGTNRGYHAHRYRGEEACTRCRVAHAAYEMERKAAR